MKYLNGVIKYIEKNTNWCGILYCFSRNECKKVYDHLNEHLTNNVTIYHAGLTEQIRSENQTKWINNQCQVIVATSAFGMGINKNDVRYIIHITLPSNMYDFAQQIGRAGRDGHPSQTIILFAFNDRKKYYFLWSHDPLCSSDNNILLRKKQQIWGILHYCLNIISCRRAQLLQTFDEVYNPVHCSSIISNMSAACDNCDKKKFDYISVDLTNVCSKICLIIKHWDTTKRKQGRSFIHLIDILKGSVRKSNYLHLNKITPCYRYLIKWKREYVEALISLLFYKQVLKEKVMKNPKTGSLNVSYIEFGPAKFLVTTPESSRIQMNLTSNTVVPK